MSNLKLIKIIDAHLFSFLKKKKKEVVVLDPHLELFIDILIEYLRQGGKHIRSLLFYKAYVSGKNTSPIEDIEKIAGIFELFQAFALIHDDIIDKEILRRGNITIHEKHGIPTALLLGNIALMYSDEILLSILENHNFVNKKLILELFQQYKQEVMLGQYLDSQHKGSIKTIVHLKTSQYTFVKPVIMGLLFAQEEKSVASFWENVLERLGEAFQLKDDYKNIFFSSEAQGKDRMSDIKEGKQTPLVKLFLKRANDNETQQLKNIFDRKILKKSEENWIIDMMVKLAVKEDIQRKINVLCDEVQSDITKHIHENELTRYINDVIVIIKT